MKSLYHLNLRLLACLLKHNNIIFISVGLSHFSVSFVIDNFLHINFLRKLIMRKQLNGKKGNENVDGMGRKEEEIEMKKKKSKAELIGFSRKRNE